MRDLLVNEGCQRIRQAMTKDPQPISFLWSTICSVAAIRNRQEAGMSARTAE
jgi:hypothetical protein